VRRIRKAVRWPLAPVAAILLLAGCASAGGELQRAGSVASVMGMQLPSSLDWSRIQGRRQELWTIDGNALNSLSILSGIKPGEHVFLLARERKSRPDGPWFRAGMRPDEIRDLVLDGLREQHWGAVSAGVLRPHRFGTEVEGLRFDIAMASPDGLLYAGTVAAAEKDGRLTILLWKAPREHYHGRDIEAVARMLDGLRFLP
jgi:hypothetical protein